MIPEDFNQRQKWILDNPHVCVLPYSVHHMQMEFDGQRNIAQQTTTFRNSCCCNLDVGHWVDSLENTVDLAEDVKRSMSMGQTNPRCYRCYDSEKQTGVSERTMALLSMPPEHLSSFVGTLQVPRFNIRIKFSNLCNLACRSCSPTFSSRYAQVHKINVPSMLTKDIGDDSENWRYITSSIGKYIEIYDSINLTLLGGESTIQPGAIKLIQWLKDQNLCGKVCLDITTNMTSSNNPLVNNLDLFKKIHVSASIDSVAENFEYVRWPGKFQNIVDNLNTFVLDLLEKKHTVTIQPLFNLNNVFYINEILDWWYQWFSDNHITNVPVSPVMMFRPFHMTVQNLPVQYRSALSGHLHRALTHTMLQTSQQGLKDYIQGLLFFTQKNKIVYDQFELFLFDTARHDLANGNKMQDGNSIFYQILTQEHKNLLEKFYTDRRIESLPAKQQKDYLDLPL